MKIIAGKFKGRNLAYRERRGVRVTSQIVKEAMFGIIAGYVEGACMCDLYCGYGTLGIEGISRGASFVTFVDVDGQALKQLKFFLDKLEVNNQAEIIKRDAVKALKHFDKGALDAIVMDPPYNNSFEVKTLEAISKSEVLRDGGVCVVEHSSDDVFPDKIGTLLKRKNKVYGDTALSIYVNCISEETLPAESSDIQNEISPDSLEKTDDTAETENISESPEDVQEIKEYREPQD